MSNFVSTRSVGKRCLGMVIREFVNVMVEMRVLISIVRYGCGRYGLSGNLILMRGERRLRGAFTKFFWRRC